MDTCTILSIANNHTTTGVTLPDSPTLAMIIVAVIIILTLTTIMNNK